MSAQPLPESIPTPSGAPHESGAPRKPRVLRSLPRPNLRLSPHFKLARFPFLLVLAGLLGVGMVGLLLLNTTLQAQAFRASELERHAAQLSYAQGEMEGKLAEASSTREMSRKASELGMRPNFFVAYVTLPDGRIIGEPKPADDKYLPAAVVRTAEQVAVDRANAAVQQAAERRAKESELLDKNKRRLEDARRKEEAKKAADAAKAAQQQQQQQTAQQQAAQQTAQRQTGGR